MPEFEPLRPEARVPVPDEAGGVRDDTPSQVGRVIGGRYTLAWRIGRGGMGSVFLARQLGVDRRVAIKLIRPEYVGNPKVVRRFLREMAATARVEHPNTVRLYDFGCEGNDVFIAMELLEGRTLAREVRERGPLSPRRCAWVGAQIARGLAASHRQGIVHRDLKPNNVMLTDVYGVRDFVKILDFGVARFADRDDEEPLTATGALVGTPEFMAPELIVPGPFDHRADLYSLGVVLYYMATAKLPFEDKASVTVMYRHVHEAAAPPSAVRPGLPAWFDAVVLRLLAKAPEDRFRDGMELACVLERAAGLGYDPRGPGDAADGSETVPLPELGAVPRALLRAPWSPPVLMGLGIGLVGGTAGMLVGAMVLTLLGATP